MKRLVLIASLAAVAAACSPQPQPAEKAADALPMEGKMAEGTMSSDPMGMMAPAEGDSEATRGYKAAMMSMMTDMPAYQGNPDADFMRQMRGHHQAAFAMAQVELAHGQNAEAKALAQEIITAQEREIGVIDAWLAANPG